jgi:hypothetical protein
VRPAFGENDAVRLVFLRWKIIGVSVGHGSGSRAYESATYHAGSLSERALLRSDEVVVDNNPPPTAS